MSRIASHLLASLIAVALTGASPGRAAPLPHFSQPTAIWNTDARTLATKPNSAQMMAHLAAFSPHGWGDATRDFDFQIDLSFYVLHANAATPTRQIVALPPASDYYSPDCDAPGSLFPVPATGGMEGTDPPSYTCNTGEEDCHLLVANDTTNVLYEAYLTASADASGVHTICGLRWDLTKTYPRYGRGEHCTSADGAGFPIAPLLFNADEVWAAAQANGDLGHAIRFILGNNRMTYRKYVHPSSHGTKATSDTNANAVPYGSRLRLKSTFDINAFSTNASVRVILRTLQKYGMFLSDGGGVPLTGESDAFTTHKWADADVNFDTHSLFGIRPTDFDVIESGDLLSVTNANDNYNDCVRTPDDFIYIDGYDY